MTMPPYTEGTAVTIVWTASASSSTKTYEAQFSASGDFTDAVTAFKGVSGPTSYYWTLPTSLVNADTATCRLRLRARTSDGNVSAWSTSAAFSVVNGITAPVLSASQVGNDIVVTWT